MKIADIPPYQMIDRMLGLDIGVTIPPREGWVVREAGYYDRPQVFLNGSAVLMTSDPEEATEAYCMALEHSKYPGCVSIDNCWIHEQQGVFGDVCSRRFWTPR